MTRVVSIKRLHEDAIIPTYGKPGDAGADLYSIENSIILPHSRAVIHTGIALEIPVGYEGQVRPRSGNAAKLGLTVLNTPGTIDAGYRGEIMVILYNTSNVPINIEKGMRIAQLVIAPVVEAKFVVTEELSDSERAEGGLGHTGTGVLKT